MSESETTAAQHERLVERHNRRELWKDVASHLRIAEECIEQALSALEDLGAGAIGAQPMLESLPTVSARIERFRRSAEVEL